MKFHLPILECIMGGTVSQIFYLGPTFHLMKYKPIFYCDAKLLALGNFAILNVRYPQHGKVTPVLALNA